MNTRFESRRRFWHMEHMQSLCRGASTASGARRTGALSFCLVVAMGAVVVGGVGCSLFGGGPKPPAVSEAAPAPAPPPEPYLVLNLTQRRVYIMDEVAGMPPESFRVAIGRKGFETPTGEFRINEMVVNPDFVVFDFNNPSKKERGRVPPGPTNPLGLRWIGFAYAHGWSVGFHGTPKTEVLGQAVSHGCVRMANADVVKLYDRVKIGTTVIVEP